MAKDTVRLPDAAVKRVEEIVEQGYVESKSAFYRLGIEELLSHFGREAEDIGLWEFTEDYDEELAGGEIEFDLPSDVLSTDMSKEENSYWRDLNQIEVHCNIGEYEEAMEIVKDWAETGSEYALPLSGYISMHKKLYSTE